MTRSMRTMPEIARTIERDARRGEELLARMRAGDASDDDVAEFSAIDAERHAFDRMCRGGHAPIGPTALGFLWGERLHHPGVDDGAVVREMDRVEFMGRLVTLAEATAMVAALGVRAAVGAWRGTAGRVGALAGLEHPASAGPDRTQSPGTSGVADRPGPDRGRNYDLFG